MSTIQETLATERATYGARLTPFEANELLNRVAIQHEGCGLLLKTSGNQFNGCALDILFTKADGHIYDCLIDAPDATQNYSGTCQPAWQDKGPMDLGRWVAPTGTAPVPPDPPPPPVDDHKEIWIALAALRTDLTALESAVKLIGAEVEDQGRRLTALEQAPPVPVPPFTFSIETGRTWGHAHSVTYPPPPK